MTDELKLTVSAIENADDKRRKAPKADYRFYKDPLWPDNSVNVEVDGKRKVLFLVSGHGEPILVYFGEKGNDHHTLNLRTGKFLYLNGKACSEA